MHKLTDESELEGVRRIVERGCSPGRPNSMCKSREAIHEVTVLETLRENSCGQSQECKRQRAQDEARKLEDAQALIMILSQGLWEIT